MKETLQSVFLVNAINGSSIAVLTLNDVKEGVAIVLGLVSIISTLLIIRENLRKARTHRGDAENAERRKAKSEPPVGCYIILVGMLTLSGCTHFKGKAARVEKGVERNAAALEEESRALTTAVVDVLSVAPTNCFESQVALTLAKQDQVIEGTPLQRLDVNALLTRSDDAWRDLRERFARENQLLKERSALQEKLRATESRLIEMGEKYEAERNRSVVRRFWGWLIGTLGIGGVIALCVFCPAIIPVMGGIASWVVGKVPGLASYFGVVSKKAFDAVVRGVGEARAKFKDGNAPALEVLNTELAKSTDAEHRELIEARRGILRV